MNKTVVYPGTFDPVTLGHIDLVRRASLMFDHTIVAVAENAQKKPLFSLDERVAMAKACVADIPGAKVIGFTGLLLDLLERQQACIVLRGLRAVSDFEFEFQLASMNRRLNDNVETIFLTPSEQYTFVSSSIIKEIARFSGDVSQFLHPDVNSALVNKYSS